MPSYLEFLRRNTSMFYVKFTQKFWKVKFQHNYCTICFYSQVKVESTFLFEIVKKHNILFRKCE